MCATTMKWRSSLLCFVTCAGLFAAPALARETDDATRGAARKVGYLGVQAYEAKDYATASEKLDKAFRVLEAPSLGLWSARALVKLGKLVEAQERYLKVTQLATFDGDIEVQKQAQVDALAELNALSPRVPAVTIHFEDAQASEVTLEVDGISASSTLIGEPRPMNPGSHRIVARRGGDRVDVQIDVAEGEQRTAILRFRKAPAAQPPEPQHPRPVVQPSAPASRKHDGQASAGSSRRTLAWVTIAAGAAGLALGGVTGAVVLGKRRALQDNEHCSDTACGPSQQSKVDSYNSLRTVSGVALIAGGVLGATGVVLLLTAPRGEAGPSASLFVTPGLSGVRGTF
jgi:tetratricopeptide (TPR) repeat protein